jgi:hypothetical protein
MMCVVISDEQPKPALVALLSEANARAMARHYAAKGVAARVYKLIEHMHFVAKPGHPAKTQEPHEEG